MADWIYRCLLRLYPRGLRESFGDDMLAFFRARRSSAAAQGAGAMVRFWILTGADVAFSLCREWRPQVDAWRVPVLVVRRVAHDVRDAWSSVCRRPASSSMVVVMLALAIGAATSVFGVVNAVLIRPLPFGDPDRIVTVWETRPDRRVDRNVVSGHEFPLWMERTRAFERMAAITLASFTLTGAGEPQALSGVRVTSAFCDVMGVYPVVGRAFESEDDLPGHGQVALVSHALWRDRFGGDPAVVGREIRLNDRPYSLIGVMPEGFRFPTAQAGAQAGVQTDVWTPIAEPIHQYRGRHYLYVVARLRPGVTMERAQDDMTRIAADLARELPNLNKDHGARVVALQSDLVRDSRASLLLLFGAVAGLVLIGCGNVAGLLVARGVARRPEMAMRLALGASRLGVARQLVAEGAILSAGASILGVGIAYWFATAAPALVPADVVRLDAVPIDLTVLSFAMCAGLATGLLFGIAPALQLRRVDLTATLKSGVRGGVGGGRIRRSLVAGQVAVTLMLVFAAGVMARTLMALQSVDPGFTTTSVLAIDLGLPGSRYSGAARQRQFFVDLVERARTLPGVVSVAASNMLPLGGAYSGVAVAIEGRPAPPPGHEVSARMRVVSADYFATMGIPVRAGRSFAASDARVAVPIIRWFPQQPEPPDIDRPQPPPVAVINERMVRAFWPGIDPIGHEFRVLFSRRITVIGIVADTREESLGTESQPQFFLHDLQEPQAQMTLLVRVNGDPVSVAPSVRSTIRSLDRDLAVSSIRSLDDVRDHAYGRPRFASRLLGAFGALALLLMAVGLYGLIAFTTSQQLPEIGVRVALGASRGAIVRMVLGQALAPTITGIVAGTIGVAVVGRAIRDAFSGVEAVDPLAWAIVATVVIAVGLVACWQPARRASRVDPAVVLRQG
jgi:predicted permease